jgi:hypothetical protein
VPDSEASPRQWRPWTLTLAGVVALLSMALLLIADAFADIMASWDTAQPGRGWIAVAAVGHGVLMACAVVLLVSGHVRASSRRAATIAAWAIVPVGVGWFLLCGRLASA